MNRTHVVAALVIQALLTAAQGAFAAEPAGAVVVDATIGSSAAASRAFSPTSETTNAISGRRPSAAWMGSASSAPPIPSGWRRWA